MYPKKCVCCQEGIIEEKYSICNICGWEDDPVQNNDERYSGGANKDSLFDYRKNYLKARNSWIEHIEIKELCDTGLVKAFYTTIDNSVWKYGKDGALDNCEKLSKTLGISLDDMTMVNQTHTSSVRIVSRKNAGEMVTRPITEDGFDGMITNEKGFLICTVEADCVPVYILDPINKAIGMVHSGWRGTAGIISVNAIKLMSEKFGSNPCDIKVVIGPCICKDCYEVGSELIEQFRQNYSDEEINEIFTHRKEDKYSLDLSKAIRISLINVGVKEENIADTGVCTYETESLCSWRRDNPVMRSMLTAIMLK